MSWSEIFACGCILATHKIEKSRNPHMRGCCFCYLLPVACIILVTVGLFIEPWKWINILVWCISVAVCLLVILARCWWIRNDPENREYFRV